MDMTVFRQKAKELGVTEKQYMEQFASEEDYLEWYQGIDLGTYKTPSVTVDNVLFAYSKEAKSAKILTVKRKSHPFIGCNALIGGFVDENETLTEACIRETEEETNISLISEDVEQLMSFGDPGRDPRTWIISVAHMVFLPEMPEVIAGDDASDYEWISFDRLEKSGNFILINSLNQIIELDGNTGEVIKAEFNFGFDHLKIIFTALTRISNKLNYDISIAQILGPTFNLKEYRELASQFSQKKYVPEDNGNIRRTHSHLMEKVGYEKPETAGRPFAIYSLK